MLDAKQIPQSELALAEATTKAIHKLEKKRTSPVANDNFIVLDFAFTVWQFTNETKSGATAMLDFARYARCLGVFECG